MSRTHVRHTIVGCALGFLAIARIVPAQQTVPPDKARIAAAVRADLTKLSDLERAYFATNGKYTTDTSALHFVPASGATIAVSYASARTFSASAAHPRLAPLLCFVIASPDANSAADKPFCTDSRYGTAAAALANAGTTAKDPALPRAGTAGASRGATRVSGVTPEQAARSSPPPPVRTNAPRTLTPSEFADRLRSAAGAPRDSQIVLVQYAVKDARYDPSRGVLEVAVPSVPLPMSRVSDTDSAAARPALLCYTRPAFVCGVAGLTYIARDLLRVPPSEAPDSDTLRSGLTLIARFAIGRRDDTARPALTLLALLLQAHGEVVSRWEPAVAH